MCGAHSLPPFSSGFPIAYVELRVFSHATEDLTKIELAIHNVIPEPLAESLVPTKLSLTGHHGNPIVIVEAKLVNKEKLPLILEKLSSDLSSLDKERLSLEIKQHIEKHNLYLRLNKQDAFLGKIKLTSDDPIRIKIHFKNKTHEEIAEICKKAGLLP
jgi:RNA-binding protein